MDICVFRSDHLDEDEMRFTVLIDGRDCGQLSMHPGEAWHFAMAVLHGCQPVMSEFIPAGLWSQEVAFSADTWAGLITKELIERIDKAGSGRYEVQVDKSKGDVKVSGPLPSPNIDASDN
jgi:hypothetical protein